MTDVLLVTGGASGIGAAVARRFARAGYRVVIADVNEADGQAVADEIDGLFVRTDVSSEKDNLAAVDAAVSTYGGLNVVHLNAGTGGAGKIHELDMDQYRRTIAVNLDGPILGMHAAIPALIKSGGGAIVVTSSIAGVAPAHFDPIYSATKHGLIGLVRSAAMTLIDDNITCNVICPGIVDTPLIARGKELAIQSGWALADPDEVAQAVEAAVTGGETGKAWTVQANWEPEAVEFPLIELSRAE